MKISIITSHYNQSQYISECIDSVRSREYPLEHIVVDSLSDDGSMEIIESMRCENMVTLFEKDKGQADGLNKGFRLASGDVMGFMNGDDYYLPLGVDKLVNHLVAGKFDFVYGGQLNLKALDGFVSASIPNGSETERIGNFSSIFEPSCVWTRKVWDDMGPFDQTKDYTFGWDFIANLVLSGKYRIGYLAEAVAVNRIHEDRKTSNHNSVREGEILEHISQFGDDEYVRLARTLSKSPCNVDCLLGLRPERVQRYLYPFLHPLLSRKFSYEMMRDVARLLS